MGQLPISLLRVTDDRQNLLTKIQTRDLQSLFGFANPGEVHPAPAALEQGLPDRCSDRRIVVQIVRSDDLIQRRVIAASTTPDIVCPQRQRRTRTQQPGHSQTSPTRFRTGTIQVPILFLLRP
ncbi:MAG: hypothetical protein BWY82_02753 [Verrucomicrobia bacterium ADurb.Bin474]|nr:MAG: hypothetical protein BWY82_02753 [Verrucomicrobia bacterium ADurb.Bin474]